MSDTKYCPQCTDPWSDNPVELSESVEDGILYCAGPDGDGCCCDFHYVIATGEMFRYEYKPFVNLWALLCVLTLGKAETQRRVDRKSVV